MNHQSVVKELFNIDSESKFNELCLEVFNYQARENSIYSKYISLIEVDPLQIKTIDQIPYLPIRFFKSKEVKSGNFKPEEIFTSSATTGMVPAKHYVKDLNIYRDSFTKAFNQFYGDVKKYTILALLPSYLERKGSSLVYMAEHLIKMSGKKESGFYLYNHDELHSALMQLKERNEPTLLLGVSFALLDFMQNYSVDFESLIVIETGGMKGRGEELSRDELHSRLSIGFGTKSVHSEYGMAELLSQAYSIKDGLFQSPPWMKIVIRDLNDPFSYVYHNGDNLCKGGLQIDKPQMTGGVNIIDLANIYSCSFIETEDMGTLYSNGLFSINGRIKDSELRGCNMLIVND